MTLTASLAAGTWQSARLALLMTCQSAVSPLAPLNSFDKDNSSASRLQIIPAVTMSPPTKAKSMAVEDRSQIPVVFGD